MFSQKPARPQAHFLWLLFLPAATQICRGQERPAKQFLTSSSVAAFREAFRGFNWTMPQDAASACDTFGTSISVSMSSGSAFWSEQAILVAEWPTRVHVSFAPAEWHRVSPGLSQNIQKAIIGGNLCLPCAELRDGAPPLCPCLF